MTGYVRKDTTNNIADGNVINAADLDAEFDGVQDAFNASTGHNHDGTSGEGAPITALGPTQDVTISAILLAPKTNNTVDIGSSALKFKDLFLAGNGSIGGTLAVTGVATLTAQPILSSLTASRAVFTDGSKGLVSNAITGTGNVVMSASPTLTGTIDAAAATLSGNLTLSGGTANGVLYLNGSKVVTSGSALTFDGTTLKAAQGSSGATAVSNGNTLVLENGSAVGMSLLTPDANASRIYFGTASNNRNAFIYSDYNAGAQTLIFGLGSGATAASEQMRLTSTGLGIGTSSPSTKLSITDSTGPIIRMVRTSNRFEVSADTDFMSLNARDASTYITFKTVDTERMRIDSSGNVGIGTSSPTQPLTIGGTGNILVAAGGTFFSSGSLFIRSGSGADLNFGANNTNSLMTLNSSGNLGLGVTPSAWRSVDRVMQAGSGVSQFGHFVSGGVGAVYGGGFYRDDSGFKYTLTATPAGRFDFNYTTSGGFTWNIAPTGTAGNAITFTQAMTLDASGNLGVGTTSPSARFTAQKASGAGTVGSFSDGTAGVDLAATATGGSVQAFNTNQTIDFKTFGTGTLNFFTNNTERARIDSSGILMVGKTSPNVSSNGVEMGPNGYVSASRNNDIPMFVNRNGNDGTLVDLAQAGTSEGSISVSGTTVSYNGGHLSRWAQTTTAKDDSLVKGTVLSNLDAMNVYTDAEGNPVDNEQLNKVKVSDVEGDINVAGVFVNWTHDDAHNVDEINMAMTGDMIIRIAQGTTVARGDLLMSAGNGTAKPQGDDIVRSKTIAKVTSNHVTCTYADGSYCVPCVLMAC